MRAGLRSGRLSEIWIDRYAFIPGPLQRRIAGAHNMDPGGWLERAVPFVSYMALHNDYDHLAVNSLWLLAFGPMVARRFGGPVPGLLSCLRLGGGGDPSGLHWGSLVPVIGASGAISGLMAAGLRLLPPAPWALGDESPAPIFSRQILVFTLVWMGINLFVGLTGFGFGGETG